MLSASKLAFILEGDVCRFLQIKLSVLQQVNVVRPVPG